MENFLAARRREVIFALCDFERHFQISVFKCEVVIIMQLLMLVLTWMMDILWISSRSVLKGRYGMEWNSADQEPVKSDGSCDGYDVMGDGRCLIVF